MSVYLYMGGLKIVEKSGVGQAILHQHKALETEGIEIDSRMVSDTRCVHLNTVFLDSVLIAIIAKLRGIKVVYYAHSTMEDFKKSFRGSDFLAPLFKKWLMFCYSFADVIITPTEYSKHILESYGLQKNIYSLSNGIDTDRFCPNKKYRKAFRRRYGLDDKEKVVISVGHTIERKGLLDFIALAREMQDVQFFWFGYTNPSLVPRTIQNAIRFAPNNVRFVGHVNQDQLREAYCGADVFAFLSKEETEGIVVLEALACKIPVIVRDIPVYDNWLTHGENVYKAGTLEEFKDTILKVFDNTLADLSEMGRKVAETRNLQFVGKQLKEIYKKEGFFL